MWICVLFLKKKKDSWGVWHSLDVTVGVAGLHVPQCARIRTTAVCQFQPPVTSSGASGPAVLLAPPEIVDYLSTLHHCREGVVQRRQAATCDGGWRRAPRPGGGGGPRRRRRLEAEKSLRPTVGTLWYAVTVFHESAGFADWPGGKERSPLVTELQFGLDHRCNVTVNNLCASTSLRVPRGKVNGSEMYGNTGSTTMTLHTFPCCFTIWCLSHVCVLCLCFCHSRLLHISLLGFPFVGRVCICSLFVSLWDLPDAFHMETVFVILGGFKILDLFFCYNQTIWCRRNYCNYFSCIFFFSFLLPCASRHWSFLILYFKLDRLVICVTIFFSL